MTSDMGPGRAPAFGVARRQIALELLSDQLPMPQS